MFSQLPCMYSKVTTLLYIILTSYLALLCCYYDMDETCRVPLSWPCKPCTHCCIHCILGGLRRDSGICYCQWPIHPPWESIHLSGLNKSQVTQHPLTRWVGASHGGWVTGIGLKKNLGQAVKEFVCVFCVCRGPAANHLTVGLVIHHRGSWCS